MSSQPRLVETRLRAERVNPREIERVKAQFRDGRRWIRRRELRSALGLSDDRLREIARCSRGEIIGSSSHGYGLTRALPVEDVHRVIAESRSRARELNSRVAEIIQVLNNRPRVDVPENDKRPAVNGASDSLSPEWQSCRSLSPAHTRIDPVASANSAGSIRLPSQEEGRTCE